MKNRTFKTLASLGFLAISCNPRTSGSDATTIIGYDNECNNLSVFVKSIDIIPLDKDCPLSYIQKITPIDSGYVISASNGIFVFDSHGRFERNLTHFGRGPAEWIRADSFAIRDSVISIFDGFTGKAVYYSLDGKYIGMQKLSGSVIGNLCDAEYMDENDLFLCNRVIMNNNNIFCLHNDSGLYALISTPVKSESGSVPTGTHVFCISGDKVLMVLPRSNVVYSYSSGQVTPIYELATRKHVLKEKELSSIDNYQATMLDNSFPGFTGIFETGKYLILNFFGLYITFVDKKDLSASTFVTQPTDFPFLTPVAKAGDNNLISVLTGYELEMFLSSYQQGGCVSVNEYNKILSSTEAGFDTFLVIYTISQ